MFIFGHCMPLTTDFPSGLIHNLDICLMAKISKKKTLKIIRQVAMASIWVCDRMFHILGEVG
jgi:hypothetical protein